MNAGNIIIYDMNAGVSLYIIIYTHILYICVMKMYDFLIIWYRKVDTGYRVQEAADKVLGLAVMEVLRPADHSLVRARCWPMLGLLAAGSPWPGPLLLGQPDPLQLHEGGHADVGLCTDTGSTWTSGWQESFPQAIPQSSLPSSWTAGTRHNNVLAIGVAIRVVSTTSLSDYRLNDKEGVFHKNKKD